MVQRENVTTYELHVRTNSARKKFVLRTNFGFSAADRDTGKVSMVNHRITQCLFLHRIIIIKATFRVYQDAIRTTATTKFSPCVNTIAKLLRQILQCSQNVA